MKGRSEERAPHICDSWREVFLNPVAAASTRTTSESVGLGHSVVVIDALLSPKDCDCLIAEALNATISSQRQADQTSDGRVRLPVCDVFNEETQMRCDAILVRTLTWLGVYLPNLRTALFQDVPLLSCIRNPQLNFACGEPAVNVYTVGGRFQPHKDKESLTVLSILSKTEAFDGGGTAFWSSGELVFLISVIA